MGEGREEGGKAGRVAVAEWEVGWRRRRRRWVSIVEVLVRV